MFRFIGLCVGTLVRLLRVGASYSRLVLMGGFVFVRYRTKADFTPSIAAPTTSKGLLLYSSFDPYRSKVGAGIESLQLSQGAPQVTPDFSRDLFPDYRKELYLSPDRKSVAITAAGLLSGFESNPYTFISGIDGKQIAQPHLGRFVSWAPDSSKALLYISPMESPWTRKPFLG